MLKILTFAGIAFLLVLRLLRGRFGARLLGVSVRVLNIVYLIVLLLAGILAVLFEQWILLGVVGTLLVLSGIEELRRQSGAKAARTASSSRRTG